MLDLLAETQLAEFVRQNISKMVTHYTLTLVSVQAGTIMGKGNAIDLVNQRCFNYDCCREF